MPKFRKKPVVIDAVQWNGQIGEPLAAISDFVGEPLWIEQDPELVVRIQTLEGWMIVSPGDYVIKGIQGEFYPCKPDIFEQTYELVDESSQLTSNE